MTNSAPPRRPKNGIWSFNDLEAYCRSRKPLFSDVRKTMLDYGREGDVLASAVINVISAAVTTHRQYRSLLLIARKAAAKQARHGDNNGNWRAVAEYLKGRVRETRPKPRKKK